MHSASKASIFSFVDTIVHFVHDQGQQIFEMAAGVVETAMTKPTRAHDHRGKGDWTTLTEVTDLTRALAAGTVDAFSGWYVRAGAGREETPLSKVAVGLD